MTIRLPASVGADFDPLGPPVRRAHLSTGRRVSYVDDGPSPGPSLLFFGGVGTSVRAVGLMGFLDRFRRDLGVRIVSVERTGLGETPFDPGVGVTEHACDVWALLDDLGIEMVSVVAVSGGGPYAAAVMAAAPHRIRSAHLVCAYAEPLAHSQPLAWSATEIAADPVAWWRFPQDSCVHGIPGFDDRVVEEATRAAFARGRDVPPDGLAHAFAIYRESPLPDLSGLTCPVVLMWGKCDEVVPVSHAAAWERALGRPGHRRIYAGEGHDIPYRHWDQVLVDVADGPGSTLVTHGGQTILVPDKDVPHLLATGGVLGVGAWSRIERGMP